MKAPFRKSWPLSWRASGALLLLLSLSLGLYRLNVIRRRAYVPLATITVPNPVSRGGQGIDAIVFSPDGKTPGGADRWNRIYLFDVASGKVKRTWRGFSTSPLAWSRDGQVLAGGSSSGTVNAYNAITGALLRGIKAVHDPNLPQLQKRCRPDVSCYDSRPTPSPSATRLI